MILAGYEGNNQKFMYANMGCVYFSCNITIFISHMKHQRKHLIVYIAQVSLAINDFIFEKTISTLLWCIF